MNGLILIDTNIDIAYLNKKNQNNTKNRLLVKDLLSRQYGSRYTLFEIISETVTSLYRQT